MPVDVVDYPTTEVKSPLEQGQHGGNSKPVSIIEPITGAPKARAIKDTCTAGTESVENILDRG